MAARLENIVYIDLMEELRSCINATSVEFCDINEVYNLLWTWAMMIRALTFRRGSCRLIR
jgi:hypothetical protein